MKQFIQVVFSTLLTLILFNQATAGGWQTQKTHWPRTIYESADMTIIKQHLAAAQQGKEPYKTLWDRIQAKANTPLQLGNKSWGTQNANASIIKARAFIYAVTGDQNMLKTINDEMTTFYTGEEIPEYGLKGLSFNITRMKNLKSSVMQSIHMAQSLTLHVQAYDILKGAGYNFGGAETKVVNNIATLAKRLYDMSNWLSSGAKTANLLVEDVEEQNNFQLKISSALGLACICLNNNAAADKWIGRAMSKFWQVYNYQTTPRGGYGEGPFYFVYAGLNFLPFFKAYNLFLDGQSAMYENYQIPNFILNDRVAATFDWHIKIRMPNGDRPGYDDGYYAPFPTGILLTASGMAGYNATGLNTNASLYAWDWLNTEKMTEGYENKYFSDFANLDLTVDIFCNFDAATVVAEPSLPPSQFLPEAGNVVFRSGWDKNAVYFHMLGENGPMRASGGVHEHPDAGSFVIYAYGELLAADAGYPGYPQHDKVNQAKNHSVMLVDGNGPTTDAYLGNFFDTPALDGASVTMSYGGADIIRNVFFVDNKYFIINDQLTAPVSHNYTWLLHGFAGGTLANSSFTAASNGGVWKRTKASLESRVFSWPGQAVYENDVDYHSIQFAGDKELPKHSVLRVKQTGTRSYYTAMVYPLAAEMTAPEVKNLSGASGTGFLITGKSGDWLINMVRGDSARVRLKTAIKDAAIATTDGVTALVGKNSSGFPARITYMKNGKNIILDKTTILGADKVCTCALSFDDTKKIYNGYYDGVAGTTTISLLWTRTVPKVTGAKSYRYIAKTKILELDFDAPGYFTIN